MNYILFLADDLELDDFGCCGGKVFTPHIDRLARSGMLLRRHCCSAAVCTPSRWECLTGQYAMRCQSASFRQTNPVGATACITWNTQFDGTTPSVAHQLAARGYRCGCFGKWHTGPSFRAFAPPELSADADPLDPAVDALLQVTQQRLVEHVRRDGGFTDAAALTAGNREACHVKALNRYHNPEWATDAALRFLADAAARRQPFFLHFATTLPHGDAPNAEIDRDPRLTMGGYLDHVPLGAEKRRTWRDRLRAAGFDPQDHRALAMLCVDDQLGALLDRLDQLGLADQTVVVVSADHNVEPGKGSVFEGGVHVPAAVRWPGVTPPGTANDALLMNVDWAATFLADAGVTTTGLDGHDVRAVLAGRQPQVREDMFFHMGFHRAVSDGRWKYVALRYSQDALARMQSPAATEAVNHLDMPHQAQACIVAASYPHSFDPDQLYDLESDPHEQVNRSDDPACAEHGRRLRARLREILATVPAHPFDLDDTAFLRSARYAELVAALRRRSVTAVPWWPAGKFPFQPGARWW